MTTPSHALPGGAYRIVMIAVLGLSFLAWAFAARRDRRLLAIYLGGVLGGFTGAKLGYIFAEIWQVWGQPYVIQALLTGKTITGALLGGYAGIEIAKRAVNYAKPTGDWFALVVPLGVVAGRIGCICHGCCLGAPLSGAGWWWTAADTAGVARWPAAAVELGFNAAVVLLLGVLRWRRVLPGQLFHVYLICYGIFRFAHEFIRDTPRIWGPFTGYHLLSLGLIVLGVWRFWARSRSASQTPE